MEGQSFSLLLVPGVVGIIGYLLWGSALDANGGGVGAYTGKKPFGGF